MEEDQENESSVSSQAASPRAFRGQLEMVAGCAVGTGASFLLRAPSPCTQPWQDFPFTGFPFLAHPRCPTRADDPGRNHRLLMTFAVRGRKWLPAISSASLILLQ